MPAHVVQKPDHGCFFVNKYVYKNVQIEEYYTALQIPSECKTAHCSGRVLSTQSLNII